MIADSGCDQTLITKDWTHTSTRTVVMAGAFAGRSMGQEFPVVSAVCLRIDRKLCTMVKLRMLRIGINPSWNDKDKWNKPDCVEME
jgi:hypothetical protein